MAEQPFDPMFMSLIDTAEADLQEVRILAANGDSSSATKANSMIKHAREMLDQAEVLLVEEENPQPQHHEMLKVLREAIDLLQVRKLNS